MFGLFNKYKIVKYKIGKFEIGHHGCSLSYTHTYATIKYVGKYKGEYYTRQFVISSKDHFGGIPHESLGLTSKESALSFAVNASSNKNRNKIKNLLLDDFKKYITTQETEQKYRELNGA